MSIGATPLKVRLLHFLKEPHSLPKSIVLSMYSLLTKKYHTDFVPFTIDTKILNCKQY